jgi:hypothetical protein
MIEEVKITKRKHTVYLNWFGIKGRHTSSIGPIIGKWQYVAESVKGKIGIVELPDYFKDGKTVWEIYSLEGQLFEKIERFDSYEEAESTVKRYLQ